MDVKRSVQREGFLRMLVLALSVLAWSLTWWATVKDRGLFDGIGVDFANYRSQTAAFIAGGGPALYDLNALRDQLEPLAKYTTSPGQPLAPGPVPFPPLFAWLFVPFALLSPPVGFAVWSLVNFLAALHLGRRAAQFFPARDRAWIIGVVVTSASVAYTIFVGEPTVLLACAFGEAYLCLRSGEDFRAGLWISVLLVKPQYGLLIGPLLIWKRQWRAVAGALTGCMAIIGASLLAAGPAALAAYPSTLGELSRFGGAATSAPDQMINWRGIILRLVPHINERLGFVLTLALGALTVAWMLWAWRGAWSNHSPRFSAQMTVLVIATLLGNYHSHIHGGPFLAVPLAALMAEYPVTTFITNLVKALVFLPTIVLFTFHRIQITAWPFSLAMLMLLVVLAWDLGRQEAGADEDLRHRPVLPAPMLSAA